MLAPIWSLLILAPIMLVAFKKRPGSSPRSEDDGSPVALAIAVAVTVVALAAQWWKS